MKATLILEDGKSFSGEALGATGERIGEVIMNTAVVGYQEMMTDPANAGKILVLTYPLIGNYGIAPKFNESGRSWLSGLVIKDKTRIYSNWQAKMSFDEFIKEQGLLVLSRIDTRTLAVHLRDKGEMLGIISTQTQDAKELLAKIKDFSKKQPLVSFSKISTAHPITAGKTKGKYKLAVLDLGVTISIIKQLQTLGCSLHIFPYNTKPEEILKTKPQGLIISGGPEGAKEFNEVITNVKGLVKRLPILGISTGCQILALSLGAKTKKMKLGHRGVNYPIAYPSSLKAEITVQNHAYIIDKDSLSKIKDVKATAFNLNDKSIEEIESKKLKLLGIQYYPVSPGFEEVNYVFKRFRQMLT